MDNTTKPIVKMFLMRISLSTCWWQLLCCWCHHWLLLHIFWDNDDITSWSSFHFQRVKTKMNAINDACAGGKHYKWIIFSTKPFCFCLLLIEKSKYVHCTVFENHFITLRAKRATLFTIFLFICFIFFSPKIHVYFSAKIQIISSWRNYVTRYTSYVFKMRLFLCDFQTVCEAILQVLSKM